MVNIGEFITPALSNTLSAFGIEVKEKGKVKEEFHILTKDINVIVGIVGKNTGILTYEVDPLIAKTIFSLMAPGMEFNLDDPMSISAISEMANMVSGAIFTMVNNPDLDITPPTSVIGEKIQAVVNTQEAEKFLFEISGGELIVGFSIS